jgi:hypothetical protein
VKDCFRCATYAVDWYEAKKQSRTVGLVVKIGKHVNVRTLVGGESNIVVLYVGMVRVPIMVDCRTLAD